MNELIDRFNAVPLTQKTLVLFLVMAGIFAAYFMGLHSPMISEIDQLNADLQSLEQEKEELQVRGEGIEDMENELQVIEGELGDLQQALKEDEVDVLARLNSQARAQQLTIEMLQREDQQVQDEVVATPVHMELTGTFDQVTEFMFAIGDMDRIITFDGLAMARDAGYLEEDGTLSVTTTATTYHAE